MKTKWLIVGLGNPEGKYYNTYHNLGFVCADLVAKDKGAEFKKKGNQLITQFSLENAAKDNVYVLKPLTYMNLSGQAVLAVARKYKIEPQNIIVFTDDLYIDKGNIRISAGGSGGGHNGLHSITELLKTAKYIRIRIGIKPKNPPPSGNANYVLSQINSESKEALSNACQKAMEAALMILSGQSINTVQSIYNTTNATGQSERG